MTAIRGSKKILFSFVLLYFLSIFWCIFPNKAEAWSEPGLGVSQGAAVTINPGSFGTNLKYNSVWQVNVDAKNIPGATSWHPGEAFIINQLPSYGGYAFIPYSSSVLNEAIDKFYGNRSFASGYPNPYTINPGSNKKYWVRDIAYNCGADLSYNTGKKEVVVIPSPLPTGTISTAPTITAGQATNISITATSKTLSSIDVPYDKYKIDYVLKVNGSQVNSGSGSKNISKQVSYTFPSAGTYTLTLELLDAFKRPYTITKPVTVGAGSGGPPPLPPPGGKPLADFDLPFQAAPKDSVPVTDRSQAYGGASITNRTWTVTPSGYTGTPSGTSYSLKFPSEGTYTVTLVVKDSKGNTSDPCSKTIMIVDNAPPPAPEPPPPGPPRASLKAPSSVGIGKPAQIYNNSSDPQGESLDVDWDIEPLDGQSNSSIDDSGLEDSGGPVIFTEEGEYKITLTVENESGLEDSDEDTIEVKNQAPKARISCPTDIMQGEDIIIKNRSSDPDGTIEDIKWTIELPTGGVIKKSDDNSVIADLDPDETKVYFDKEGEYKITLTVKDDWGKEGTVTETIVVKPAIPIAFFRIYGVQKENRALRLEGLPQSPSRYPVVIDQNQWEITPVADGAVADAVKFRVGTPDDKSQRLFVIKEAGMYKARFRVTNTAGHTSEWYEQDLKMNPDEPPIADFNVQSAYLRNPEDSNYASIVINDLSYSPDGDFISKRVWKYRYDSDNDGDFTDEAFSTFDIGNNPSPILRVPKLGKYQFELQVTEGFGEPLGTLTEFISAVDYLTDNTDDKVFTDKVAEVINTKPVVAFEALRKKKIDIIFTVGDVNASKVTNLNGLITTHLETKLNSNNVQYGTIEAMETSSVDSQTSFPWQGYNLYGNGARGTGDGQFASVGSGYNYRGYGSEAPIDHLYYDDGKDAKREFTFNIDMAGYNACATVIPAFICGADDKNGRFKGYIAMMWHNQIGVYYFDGADHGVLTSNGAGQIASNRYPSSFGGVTVATVNTKDTSLQKSFRMVYKSGVLEIYDGGTLLQKVDLPNAAGNGYGIAAVNSSHGCGARSTIKFDNFNLTTSSGVTLDEILKNPIWRDDAMHFLVNISDVQYPEFNDPVKSAYIYSKLLTDKIDFAVLGTAANSAQTASILARNDGNGTFIRNDQPNMNVAIQNISDYIMAKVNAGFGGPTNYILLNEEIEYKTYYHDYENDPENAQRWQYEHDELYFENSLGKVPYDQQWIGDAVYRFDKVGKFVTTFQKKDSPTPDNRFDEYRLWAELPMDKLELYVHRRPIGTFTFQMHQQ